MDTCKLEEYNKDNPKKKKEIKGIQTTRESKVFSINVNYCLWYGRNTIF